MKYKMIFPALLAAVSAFSMSEIFVAAESRSYTCKAYLKSDVNSDGFVDAVDASAVLSDYVQTSTGHESSFSGTFRFIADYDNNEIIDAVDASEILANYAHNSVSGNERNYSMVTFEVEYFFGGAESDTFYADSYEECLEFIASDKQTRSIRNPGYYKLFYNEAIFGEVYDGVYKVVHTDHAP